MTAMGLAPEIERTVSADGPRDGQADARTVITYMGAKDVPAVKQLFTNAFAAR